MCQRDGRRTDPRSTGRVTPQRPGAAFGQSIVEGWTFSWRTAEVRAGLLITMGASLFMMPFTTLLPVFARDLLDVGATGQGGLLTAMGLGAVGSAVLVASLGDRLPRGLLMLGGVMLYGLSVVAVAVSPSFWLSLRLAGRCPGHTQSHPSPGAGGPRLCRAAHHREDCRHLSA